MRRYRKKVRYRAIRFMLTNHPSISIRQLEGVLGFSRQGYYQYWQRQVGQVSHEADILQLVKTIRQDHPRIGGRKLYWLLQEAFLEKGIKLGRDSFFELLALNKLLIRRPRRRVRTTFRLIDFANIPT